MEKIKRMMGIDMEICPTQPNRQLLDTCGPQWAYIHKRLTRTDIDICAMINGRTWTGVGLSYADI